MDNLKNIEIAAVYALASKQAINNSELKEIADERLLQHIE
jgi:hypothetical protein